MQITCIYGIVIRMNTDIENLLKEHALKITKERVLLLSLLKDSHKPLSAEEIAERIESQVNLVTIYRTLERFVNLGILYKAHFGGGKAYYEFQNKHHHHITCTECGVQEKIDMCIKSDQVSSKNFSVINNHVLEFFGICKKCN